MAFAIKTWYDAPNPLTPLNAAALNDLEARINAIATQADAFNLQPAVGVTHSAAQTIATGAPTLLQFDTNRFDVDAQHFTSSANLTGTVAKTAASTALVGTGTLFTSQLSVGQIIDVPGTAVETRVVTAIADDTHLTVAGNYANTAAGQTATRNNKGVVARTAGVYSVTANVEWANNNTNVRHIQVQKFNLTGTITTVAWALDDAVNSGAAPFRMGVAKAVKLAQWEFLVVTVTQGTGGNLNINNAADYSPEFTLVRTSAG